MCKIVGIVAPNGVLNQKVYALDSEGNELNAVSCFYENMSTIMTEMAKQYNANEIIIKGPVDFTDKLRQELENIKITEFSNNNIKITMY